MITFGDKVKVVNLKEKEMMNLYGGYDDITIFLGKDATVKSIYDKDTPYERFGLEFDHWGAQVTRERTGYIFDKEELESI